MKSLIQKTIVLSCVMLLALSATGCKIHGHTHSYSDEWSSDETYHWHDPICEDTDEVSDKEEHTFGDWTVTKEATAEAEGSKERTCTVCSYKETAAIAKLKKSEDTDHTHTYAEDWTSDDTDHWHKATCDHTDEISGKASHTFDTGSVTTEPTCSAYGVKTYKCTVCGKTKTEDVEKKAHTFDGMTCSVCGYDKRSSTGVTVTGGSNTYDDPQD